jgi:two-component system C4-dicarboxylate transport sensor histidine kinase DctB
MREPASQFFRVFQRHPLGWLVILLLLVLATWLAHFLAERAVIEGLRRNGVHRLELYVTGLESELARYDYLPMVLTLNQDVIGVLKRPDNASVIALANRYLQRVNEQARTAAIYVLDPRGLVLASSNWNERVSFVGMDLSYRPYFQEALKGMSGRFYGIGTTSGDPGYYFSHGIYDAQRMLGVAAVKVSLDKLERLWTQGSEPVIVSDRYGVILLSSDPSWKFKTLRPISQETMAMFAATRQYDGATLEPIDLLEGGDKNRDVRVVTLGERTLLAHTRAMPETGWAVTILSDLAPARAFARNTAAAAAFAFGFLLLLLLYLSQRRRAIHASLAAKEALQRAHDELERKVAERTADLVAANQQLEGEVAERVRAEQVLRQAQEELVQAGKLAVLGQLSAGITHELNQPLAAMRTLSDNAVVRLDRNEPDAARRNLSMISSLVERMAKITSQLKAFARKSPGRLGRVSLASCITNAMAIVEQRIRPEEIELEIDTPASDVVAVCDSNRLEQVLVNLFGNALDAMAESPVRRLRVRLREEESRISISVQDSGPGIPDDVLPRLFEPFFTTKEAGRGLGLGLAISAGIVRDFGGRLIARNLAHGAEFVVELPRVTADAGVAHV